MSGIKKLAGQTLWYGVPNIVGRFLNFGMSLLGFRLYDPSASSYFTQVYAVIPFLTILFTYGLETSYFRFAQTHDRRKLYNTLNVSIISSTVLFTAFLFLFKDSVVNFMEMEKHPEFITWMLWILFFDTLIAIPMAKLRLEERPQKYAFINFFGIILNIGLVIFFYYVAKPAYEADHRSFLGSFFDPAVGIGYFILANVIASAIKMLLLWKEFAVFKFEFDSKLWKDIIRYAAPLLIVGMGGMINEMLSRAFYQKILHDDPEIETFELGVFGANYRLAILVTIFIQMFKMAAEPFFFSQSKNEGAQRTYARVMKFFVIACCFMFLGISLFMDVWKYLIASKHPEYAEGLNIVPILAMANIFLGIYYNLSVWYKLTNKNMVGAYVTVAGAVITIVLNFVLVPEFRYTGAAWATFVCYTFMMVISYKQGQKHYKIPYPTKKLITYLVICTLMYVIHEVIIRNVNPEAGYYYYVYYGTSFLFVGLFTLLILKVERKELINLPVIGKYVERFI
ncbi:MAG: polysaccharide biosynthesis protein [Chitinophagaceae bacterium]|nr:MAG: polysaccharide biosynthesis protein [Chitinophagaceae bacterium]